MLLHLFIAALWSPAGKGLTSWLFFVMFIVFCHFPNGILGQVWYLVVSIPEICIFLTFIFAANRTEIFPHFAAIVQSSCSQPYSHQNDGT